MRQLLRLAAALEGLTGLALMAAPAIVVRVLLGADVGGASLSLGRVAGAALLALAIACWPMRNPARDDAPAFRAMLLYNALVGIYLLYVGIRGAWVGPLLWPVAVLHSVLAILLARPAAASIRR